MKGKRALVTGGASGIGAAICDAFGAKGVRTVVVDLNAGAAEAKAKEIGNGAVAIACDVADPASVKKAVDGALETLGEIDILVNSAGVVFLAPAEALPLDDWDRTIVTHSPSTGVRRLLIRPALL